MVEATRVQAKVRTMVLSEVAGLRITVAEAQAVAAQANFDAVLARAGVPTNFNMKRESDGTYTVRFLLSGSEETDPSSDAAKPAPADK